MGASFTSQSVERVRAQKRKSRWYKVIACLSAVVVFCTTYALVLPAITKEQPVYCGYTDQHTDECYEEVRTLTCTIPEGGHVHTDKCYETTKALSCTLTEGEGHTHSDACYETIQTLVCTDPEHAHDESCYSESRVLICGVAEAAPHHHSDSCYTEQKTLACGFEEADAHTHTDECYTIEKKLICDHKVHEHTLQCYSDPEADVETRETWERTVERVELTDDWNADVLAIAKTQLGYHESTANYEVQANGVSMKGYTRYGAWYGIPYGDWCAMFCSFCLNYAEVDPKLMPRDANCPHWIRTLSSEDFDLYHPAYKFVERLEEKGIEQLKADAEEAEKQEADEEVVENEEVIEDEEILEETDEEVIEETDEETTEDEEEKEDTYIPRPGDLIFFDWNSYSRQSDRESDHIGFVAELIYEEVPAEFGEEAHEELTKIRTIEGNSADQVRYVTYDIDDDRILGYGELPEKPAEDEEEDLSFPSILSSWLGGDMRLMALAADEYEPDLTFRYRTADANPTWNGSYDDEPKYLFDGDQGTKYCVNLNWYQSGNIVVICQANSPTYVTRYALRTGNDNAANNRVQSNGWNLYGSNTYSQNLNDGNWKLIDAVADGQTGMTNADYARYEYDIDDPGTYQYFAIEFRPVRTGNESQNFFQFSEWDMIAPVSGTPSTGTTYTRKTVHSVNDLLGQYVIACLNTTDNKKPGTMDGSLVWTTNNQGVGRTQVEPRNSGSTIEGEDLTYWTITDAGSGKVNLCCANGYLILTHSNGLRMTNDITQATDFSVTVNNNGSFKLSTSDGWINSSGSDDAFINYWQAGDDLWLYADDDAPTEPIEPYEPEEPTDLPNYYTGKLSCVPVYELEDIVGRYAIGYAYSDRGPGVLQDTNSSNGLVRGGVSVIDSGSAIEGSNITMWDIALTDDGSKVTLHSARGYLILRRNSWDGTTYCAFTSDPAQATQFTAEISNAGTVILKGEGDKSWLNSSGSGNEFIGYTGPDGLYLYNTYHQNPGNVFVWYDGTDGGLMNLRNSPNVPNRGQITDIGGGRYTLELPSTWVSPVKYQYKLFGWYDIYNKKYYPPGATATITGSTVFYADWRAATYDVGEYNAQVLDDVVTKNFITNYVFDYSVLFDIMSETVTQNSLSATGHSETWELQQSGQNAFTGQNTLDFIFLDYDSVGMISYPNSQDTWNMNHTRTVTQGVIDHVRDVSGGKNILSMLFDPASDHDPATGKGVVGVSYVGQGDQFYHFMELGSPNYDGKHNGYYYYDSTLNAASYNQSEQRFFVYDYLERTTDSLKDRANEYDENRYSDLLPFNSPYANNAGSGAVVTSSHPHNGRTVYTFDAKDVNGASGAECTLAHTVTNYFYGVRSDINFFLPNNSGYYDEDGILGNQSTKGEDMVFEFTGDDDVWVFVDNELILDIGGMHGTRGGKINFSTGDWVVYNKNDSDQEVPASSGNKRFTAGEHTLQVFYMERGSSQANCAIYFNLAPRYAVSLDKIDAFRGIPVPGAVFEVFTDAACTQHADTWPTEQIYRSAYNAGGESGARQAAANYRQITVGDDGKAYFWGLAAGRTYYLKETSVPDGYRLPNDVIRIKLNNRGQATYSVEIVDKDGERDIDVSSFEVNENEKRIDITVSNQLNDSFPFTVRKTWLDANGDPETQQQASVHPPIHVRLQYNGSDLTGIGLNVPNGILSAENNWTYTWYGIPKTWQYEMFGSTYTIDLEDHMTACEWPDAMGYTSEGEYDLPTTGTTTKWVPVTQVKDGATYILFNEDIQQAITTLKDDSNYYFGKVSLESAKGSNAAKWTAEVSGSYFRLINLDPKAKDSTRNYDKLGFHSSSTFTHYNSYNDTDDDNGLRYTSDHHIQGTTSGKYVGQFSLSDNKSISCTTDASQAANITLYELQETTGQENCNSYRLTNRPIPAENQTRVEVEKTWYAENGSTRLDPNTVDLPPITVELFAGGEATGRELTLSKANSYRGSFEKLPLKDKNGKTIQYSLAELPMEGYASAEFSTEVTTGGVTQIEKWSTLSGSVSASSLTQGTVYRFSSGSYALAADPGSNKLVSVLVDSDDLYQRWRVTSKTGWGDDTQVVLQNVGTGMYFDYLSSGTWTCYLNSGSGKGLYLKNGKLCWRLQKSGTEYDEVGMFIDRYTAYPAGFGGSTSFTVSQLGAEATTTYRFNSFEIRNTRVPTVDISVHKSWYDGELAHTYDSVTIHLYRNGEDTGNSLVLSRENNWQGEFTGMNKFVEPDSTQENIYTLVEDEIPGYTPMVTLTKGSDGNYTAEILNAQPGYELPESGGGGTTIFYAFGGALMLLAVMCGFSMRRKRERGSTR